MSRSLIIMGLAALMGLWTVGDLCAYFDEDFEIQRHFLPKEENHFDWKAYQLPLSLQRQWHTTKNGIQATSGSLSQEFFYLKQDIKFQTDLHKNFSLFYRQEREEFYKSEPVYQQIEARFGHRYYVSILGFPQYEKKSEDIGFALAYNEPYARKHVKLTYLNQLATYNAKNRDDERNDATDSLDSTPMLFRLETRYRFFDKLDLILDLEQEMEGALLDEIDGLKKTYSGHNYRGTLLWSIDNRWLCGLSFQKRLEQRRHRPFNPVGTVVLDQAIDHYYVDIFGNVRFKEDELTFGYLDSGFNNEIDAADVGRNYRMRLDSRQIYGKWQNPINHWIKWLLSLQVGTYDVGKTGAGSDDGIKSKAGVGLIFYKADTVHFVVLTTWAADSLSDGQWDGGNMQLQLTF